MGLKDKFKEVNFKEIKANLSQLSILFFAAWMVVVLAPLAKNTEWPTVMFSVIFVIWGCSGLKKLPVGWRGLLLALGRRTPLTLSEGWQFVPFPFSFKAADCRQSVLKLRCLDVFTLDNVKVSIEGSIIRQIVDLNLYFGLNASSLAQGLDDIWDEIIRTRARTVNLADLMQMTIDLAKEAEDRLANHSEDNHWGIKVLKVVIAGIKPDQKITDALELKKGEELERDGQMVEIEHVAARVMYLMTPYPKGPGYTREQAIEQVQLSTGKLTKTAEAKTFGIDPAVAEIIANVIQKRG